MRRPGLPRPDIRKAAVPICVGGKVSGFVHRRMPTSQAILAPSTTNEGMPRDTRRSKALSVLGVRMVAGTSGSSSYRSWYGAIPEDSDTFG